MIYLITGGTGSLGRALVRLLLETEPDATLRVFSRDEWKQEAMAKEFPSSRVRFLIGDVRDASRLHRAFRGVDRVIHAAALKQVPSCEYNPIEAVKTNVYGATNVIEAALDNGVRQIVALSTDKAANPVNLYGATKLCSDKLFIHGNSYAGHSATDFSVVRYGNVVGSRGSVVPLFLEQRKQGRLTITDPRMTRFWITLEDAAVFVRRCFDWMKGGEIFVPKLASMRVTDLARVLAPGAEHVTIGIRPGEKLHEVLLTEDDARTTFDFGDRYEIHPQHPWWHPKDTTGARQCSEGFRYASDTNDRWLEGDELLRMVERTMGSPTTGAGPGGPAGVGR